MDITAEESGQCLVVTVNAGEIDLTVSDAFKRRVIDGLSRHGLKNLLMDLSAVRFMDSKAIGAMVAIRKTVAGGGGRMGLCGLHPHVKKIVAVVTLNTIFDLFEDRAAALEVLA